ncbi:MAG: HAD-IB family phosphatase [Parcubacteria group bacterium]
MIKSNKPMVAMKKYAFFDLDGTLYDGYTTSSFYLFLAEKGFTYKSIIEKHDEILKLFDSKKVDYKELCERAIVLSAEALKGKDRETVSEWNRLFLEENGKFFSWVNNLLKLLKGRKYEIYLITGSINSSVKLIADYLGIKHSYSSELEIKNEVYTGKVNKFLHFDEKEKLIRSLVEDMENCDKIRFGDSTGDVNMLSNMDISFVYKPFEEQMKEIAIKKG